MGLSWNDCRHVFVSDGSLRDIYVQDTQQDDWVELLAFVTAQGYSAQYSRDGVEEPLPSNVDEIFADRVAAHSLTFYIGGVRVNGYYFELTEIELDIEPREIASEIEFNILLDFISGLGGHLSKDVILTEENAIHYVYIRYLWQEARFELTPAHQ